MLNKIFKVLKISWYLLWSFLVPAVFFVVYTRLAEEPISGIVRWSYLGIAFLFFWRHFLNKREYAFKNKLSWLFNAPLDFILFVPLFTSPSEPPAIASYRLTTTPAKKSFLQRQYEWFLNLGDYKNGITIFLIRSGILFLISVFFWGSNSAFFQAPAIAATAAIVVAGAMRWMTKVIHEYDKTLI